MALLNQITTVVALLPQDITGAGQSGQWVSLRRYARAQVVIIQGAWAGGTPAVGLLQGIGVAGVNAKVLPFTTRYQHAWNVGTGPVASAVTANTFNLPNTPNQVHLIEVEAASLDVDNGFDSLRLSIANPGAFADVLAAYYILGAARYVDPALPNALAN
jgi:hypothetical protein